MFSHAGAFIILVGRVHNFESNNDANNHANDTFVTSTYFDCRYPWVAHYVYNYYYENVNKNARRMSRDSMGTFDSKTNMVPVDEEKWLVDTGFYYSSLRESVYLMKGNKVNLIQIDGGIESDDRIAVIKDGLKIGD